MRNQRTTRNKPTLNDVSSELDVIHRREFGTHDEHYAKSSLQHDSLLSTFLADSSNETPATCEDDFKVPHNSSENNGGRSMESYRLRSKGSNTKSSSTSFFIPGITGRARCLEDSTQCRNIQLNRNQIISFPSPSNFTSKNSVIGQAAAMNKLETDIEKHTEEIEKLALQQKVNSISGIYIPGVTERSRRLARKKVKQLDSSLFSEDCTAVTIESSNDLESRCMSLTINSDDR